LHPRTDNIEVNEKNLPCVYPAGTLTNAHASIKGVVLESVKKSGQGSFVRHELAMDDIEEQKFTLDIGHTHVVEAIG
jgi:hypothetical protein